MLLLRRAGDPAPFEEALVHACLHNQAYDPQCEHDRSAYLARLILETGDRTRLFTRLASRIDDPDVDVALLFDVIARLAAEGGEAEAAAVRRAYADLPDEGRLDAMEAMVRLDGLPALLRCAERLEQDLDEDGWRGKHLLDALKTRGKPDIDRALSAARAEHPSLERLMAHLEAPDAPTLYADWPRDFPTVRAELRRGIGPRGALYKVLSDDEWRLICEDFRSQTQVGLARPYLRLFARRRFIGGPAELVGWMNGSDSRASWSATLALGWIASPLVREMALQQLRAGKPRGARLLQANYRPGDFDLLLPMLRDAPSDEVAHDLSLAVLDLIGENNPPIDESLDILVALYEHTPCSMCRGDAVSHLVKAGQTPTWIAEECRFDADPNTAGLFAAPGCSPLGELSARSDD
ncbi:hypothetical protein [Caulobacter mirabilis]|uniref:Uncharacterized protein n=1 Tax=Caulobacter mirabilis TaxID=69666 RepID=A0A2D2AVL6_9CAUL|nr:hypothetical protein [Caulobacter mirabilis]ATQ42048.1 hypothetical protein CSW64_06270 [Caulobacter mirabilis]